MTGRVELATLVTRFGANETRESVVVSPLTSTATALAFARVAAEEAQGDIGTEAELVFARLGGHLGDVDVARTIPTDPTRGAGAVTPDIKLGIAQAGLSRLAYEVATQSNLTAAAINSATLTAALVDDAAGASALLDGQGGQGAVSLGACPLPVDCDPGEPKTCDTPCRLDSLTLRTEWGQEMLAFLNSSRNATGLYYADVAPFLEHVVANTDAVLFPTEELPDPLDQEGPMIEFEAPTPPQGVVQGVVMVRARATDSITPPARLRIVAPAWLADDDGDENNAVVTASFDASAQPDDVVEVVLEARDSADNVSQATRKFFIDRGPPAIDVVSPTDGNAYGGAVVLDATAYDSSLASFVIAAPAALTGADTDGTLEHIQATIPKGQFPDGDLTISLVAVDGANNVQPASITVTLDTQAPSVSSVMSPSEGLLTKTGTLTVSGTATDATSGVEAVDVIVDGVGYPATLTGPPEARSFTVTVSLTADTCGAVGWSGTNFIEVRARDRAGNMSLAATRTVTYDPCAPTLSVVSHDLDDERDYEAGWLKTSARPCLFRRAVSPAKTTLGYDLASGGAGPTVYKYAINTAEVPYFVGECFGKSPSDISLWEQPPPVMTAYASDSNAIEWWLDVRDNVSVSSVTYRIKPPGGSFGAATPAPVKSMMGSTVTHAIKLTSSSSLDTPGAAGDLGGNAPGLIDKEGTWEIEVTATDAAGNAKTPMTIKFSYVPLAGPVLVRDLPIVVSDGLGFPPTAGYKYPDKTLFGLESTSSASVSQLFGAAGNTIVLRRYEVLNGTRFAANVKLTVGTVTTSGSRTINERNPFKQHLTGAGPLCNPNAFNTANNACLNPVPTDTTTTTALPNNPSFIKAIELWYQGASSKAPFCAGCTDEWTIDAFNAVTMQPGKATAYVLTSALTALWDGDASPVPASDIIPDISAPDPALFGIQKMIWGENWIDESNGPPFIAKRKLNVRVKYLQSFMLTVSGSVTATSRLPTSPSAALVLDALPDSTSPLPAGLSYSTTENASVPAYVPPPMF